MFLWEQFAKRNWKSFTDAAFQHFKAQIINTLLNTKLIYYDRTQPVIGQTDASKYGLGATLIHNSQPIAFASKTLTYVETCYWERVPVSVIWSKNSLPTYMEGMSSSRMAKAPGDDTA